MMNLFFFQRNLNRKLTATGINFMEYIKIDSLKTDIGCLQNSQSYFPLKVIRVRLMKELPVVLDMILITVF